MFRCIERWLLQRRDAFVNRHIAAANFVVADADTTRQIMRLLAAGQVARPPRYPDDLTKNSEVL